MPDLVRSPSETATPENGMWPLLVGRRRLLGRRTIRGFFKKTDADDADDNADCSFMMRIPPPEIVLLLLRTECMGRII